MVTNQSLGSKLQSHNILEGSNPIRNFSCSQMFVMSHFYIGCIPRANYMWKHSRISNDVKEYPLW